MELKKLIKEIDNSQLDPQLILKKRAFSIEQLKDYFLNSLIKLTENKNAYLFTKEKTTFDIEINSIGNDWNYTIYVDKKFKKLVKVGNLVLDYQFLGNQVKIWISNSLYNYLDKVQVFVRTDIEYLQFEKLKSEGINDYNTWKFEGPIYGNPSENYVVIKFLLTNGSKLFVNLPVNYNLYYPFGVDYKVEIYKITDIPYLVDTIYPSFSLENNFFVYSGSISKTNEKEVLAIKIKIDDEEDFIYWKTYLPVSYKDFPFLRTYIYDLALSILTFVSEFRLSSKDYIKSLIVKMFNSSKNLLNSKNSFNFSYPSYGFFSDEYIRNGSVAWLLEALAKAYKYIPELQTLENKNFIKSIADYLIGEIQSNGLVRGGYGIYDAQYNFDASYVVPWYSTEHNIDSYFALKSVYDITNESIYNTKAEQIKNSIINNIYDGEKLTQGYQDTAGALDIYTWGTIFLYKIEFDINKVFKNYQYLDQFFKIRPTNTSFIPNLYKPYSNEFGYPGAKNLLWFEGYFQALYAKYLVFKNELELREDKNKIQNFILKELLPYAVGYDDIYEIGEYPSIASISWFLFFYYLYYHNLESFWY
ncbi:hypothetical protein YS40_030 [Thermus phage phiYS40]|uniref:hypothetical protein n=1 Tax=Thermus phage phiYS40 TaxID=407392 RepID=UPI0000E68994|nr:hypothetical protein YS40_030 [Thermus phage phiYS40]ABJ91424.1 hypothetical protein YS40_030 [Thermus phage phiYS40]BAK53548.1 hypothetical protein YSP_030 [Thermus phage phiYS40]